MNKVKLFCLPYAGAGSLVYAKWHKYLNRNIEVRPIALPGREKRIKENLVADAKLLCSQILDEISAQLNSPYIILGHSMGGVLTYELTVQIQEKGLRLPEMLIISASSLKADKYLEPIYKYSDDQIAVHLEKMGGTPSSLLHNHEFRKCFFPIIKNDYRLVDTYHSSGKKVACKIIALGGHDDREVSLAEVKELSVFTDDFEMIEVPGEHFYINEERSICPLIEKIILGCL